MQYFERLCFSNYHISARKHSIYKFSNVLGEAAIQGRRLYQHNAILGAVLNAERVKQLLRKAVIVTLNGPIIEHVPKDMSWIAAIFLDQMQRIKVRVT
jgi:hypothetical protein